MLPKFLALSALLGAAYAQAPKSLSMSLNDTLSSNNLTTQLASLLASFPSLVANLSSLTNVTILAPSNNAIAALLNSSAGQQLTANPGEIQAVLEYHVLNGSYPASAITNMTQFIPTTLTNVSYANVTGGQRVQAMTSGNKVEFFSGLLQNSTVVQADLNFTGGVIHVINNVLTLPQNISTTLIDAGLSSLYGALNATNLLNTVNGFGNVTIFAPSNKAFEAIGSGIGNLSITDLTSILEYHVLFNAEPLYSTSLMNGTSVVTLNGGNVTITVTSAGSVFINDAKVVTPDVLVAGGVVHIIDEVLNPNNTKPANGTATSGSPAFSGASSVSTAPFTSGVPTGTSVIAVTVTSVTTSSTSTSSKAGAAALQTGAVGAAALFGAGAAWVNLGL